MGDDQAKRFRREVHFPSGRFGEAIEQAQAVLFLASDESSFVNGTDFVVDGGLSKVSLRELKSASETALTGSCRPMSLPRAPLPLRPRTSASRVNDVMKFAA